MQEHFGDLIGRSEQKNQLLKALDAGHSAIAICGAGGTGKTALATWFMSQAHSKGFHKVVPQSAYQESWARVISNLGEKLLDRETVLKATESEVENGVLQVASTQKVFLLIDNVENYHQGDVLRFIRRWSASTRGKAGSILVLTSRESLDDPSLLSIPLGGLLTERAQLDLLGDVLRTRFGDGALLDSVKKLDGIPLNLVYLRWLDPMELGRLREHVDGLAGSMDSSITGAKAVGDILKGISHSPTSFLALGVVRSLEFDERLMAYFWDQMAGGRGDAYVDFRERLVESGLIIPAPSRPGTLRFRLNESIHKQLEASLRMRIGGDRIAVVEFFASEYFREVFEREQTNLNALDAFVYHCFRCEHHARAYAYIFESGVLNQLHTAGMVLQLKDLLERFHEHSHRFTAIERCRILVQMCHVANDLSQFDRCLELRKEAESELDAIGDGAADGMQGDLRFRLSYYSAIAFSNTGHSKECLKSYYSIVASSSATSVGRLNCLSLAYLAHELKYHDLDKSIEYGEQALRFARDGGDESVIARALCSVAESYVFDRNFGDAERYFEEGASLCRTSDGQVSDPRELGRILKNWAVVKFLVEGSEAAIPMLAEARRLSERIGDRRRVASGDLYRAIVRYRQDRDGGIKDILGCILTLDGLGDGRYLVPCVLTYAKLLDRPFPGRISALVDSRINKEAPEIVKRLVEQDGRYECYASFYRDHFWPTLFSWVQ